MGRGFLRLLLLRKHPLSAFALRRRGRGRRHLLSPHVPALFKVDLLLFEAPQARGLVAVGVVRHLRLQLPPLTQLGALDGAPALVFDDLCLEFIACPVLFQVRKQFSIYGGPLQRALSLVV